MRKRKQKRLFAIDKSRQTIAHERRSRRWVAGKREKRPVPQWRKHTREQNHLHVHNTIRLTYIHSSIRRETDRQNVKRLGKEKRQQQEIVPQLARRAKKKRRRKMKRIRAVKKKKKAAIKKRAMKSRLTDVVASL